MTTETPQDQNPEPGIPHSDTVAQESVEEDTGDSADPGYSPKENLFVSDSDVEDIVDVNGNAREPPRKRARLESTAMAGAPMPIPQLSTDDEESEDEDQSQAERNSTVYDAWNPFEANLEPLLPSSLRTPAQQAQAQLAEALEKETIDPTGHVEEFRASRVGFGFISDANISSRLKWKASEKAKFCALIARRTAKDMYEIAEQVGKSVMECQAYLDILEKGSKRTPKTFSYEDIEAATEIAPELVEETPPPSPEPTEGVVQQESLELLDLAKLKARAESDSQSILTEDMLLKLRDALTERTVCILEQALHHQFRGGGVTTEHFNWAIRALTEARCEHDSVYDIYEHEGNESEEESDEDVHDDIGDEDGADPALEDEPPRDDDDLSASDDSDEDEGELEKINQEAMYLEAVDMRNSAIDIRLEQVPPAPIAPPELQEFMRLA